LTLADARAYILKLGNTDQQTEPWQAAIAVLMMAAEERGPIMHARIGLLRAINQHKLPVFDPSRKEPHWGKPKLKRDLWDMRSRKKFPHPVAKPWPVEANDAVIMGQEIDQTA
jgi:hypothetical protein